MNTIDERLRRRLSRMLPDIDPPRSDGADAVIERRLFDARAAFVRGYREALSATPNAAARLFQNESFERRGFALEGAGLAMVLMDACVGGSGRWLGALMDGRSPAERTLVALGAGWAGARLRRPANWRPEGVHPRHARFVADGYGFHQGFFHAHRFEGGRFPEAVDSLAEAYDIGLGRALWFVHIGRTELVAQDVDRMPQNRRGRLWRGVGTACAFTGTAEQAAAATCKAAGWFEPDVREGLESGTHLLRALARPKKEAIL